MPRGVKASATSLAMVGVKWERKVCALGVAEGEGKRGGRVGWDK